MTPQHIEEIGSVADSISNLLGALALPLSPQMHIEGLKPNLFYAAVQRLLGTAAFIDKTMPAEPARTEAANG